MGSNREPKSVPESLPDSEVPQFVGINRAVMQGIKCVAVAYSHTFAKRIARALNLHKPNERGY